jgi:hypothetical protein
MNNQDFQYQFKRLSKRFRYDEEFSKQLWLKLMTMPIDAFQKAVDEIMGNNFTMLGVYSIAEMVARAAQSNGSASQTQFIECAECNGFGITVMHGKVDQRTSAFACSTCLNGQRQYQNAKNKTHGSSGIPFIFRFSKDAKPLGYVSISEERNSYHNREQR